MLRFLLEHAPRMRPEAQRYALHATITRFPYECIEDEAVAKMHTVKEACCYYSHLTMGKSSLCGRASFLGYTLVAT